jgi:hypothetical protein
LDEVREDAVGRRKTHAKAGREERETHAKTQRHCKGKKKIVTKEAKIAGRTRNTPLLYVPLIGE